MNRALITGLGGQDGSYLAELLLERGYEVHGVIRRQSTPESQSTRYEHINDKVETHYGDLLDEHSLYRIMSCLLYTSPSPRDGLLSRMPSSA